MAALEPPPPRLRPIQHHLRVALEHEKRDPVVAYYCRLYAVQTGLKLDDKSPECRKFLGKLMDLLESMKKQLATEEAVSNDVVGTAHIEGTAINLFTYADNEDRAGRFNKNMMRAFFTSNLLFDVLAVFGELSEENIQQKKYAKWKAAYLHNCFKTGETPVAGPIGIEGVLFEDEEHEPSTSGGGPQYTIDSNLSEDIAHEGTFSNIQVPHGAHAPANTPAEVPHHSGDVRLTAEDFTRAQKYCKFAGSALQYEDVNTAVQNLQKALKLLTMGRE
ncbi:vacuolar protein sorting-associated protein VTA1 homolog isoform X3 [Callorhinchus milii]|uniref:vacuolar protein sorting-associated protein VTA1 homolog isoform X3 n=1 Tax=Callorhinchus milii TaxID=7868 RepID=UPI0004572578|nr:vacuolar protein sorting-associated protein VTA1 homolog isoform X3 [Callorhinchus milii]|eukprot:gi/632975958/ref/XP_007904524.1/ PREDICTED: vacuolar protein sorting-associated protein VTA1 homolog [Callorhinchus milii]